ncbi:beta-sandwich domain-containing protein [Methanomassiliicoccus luminyensis]|uniref:beta-sandwich domain-containing protein n=1 Tax=Methanomassiliicoccus luminyensis TaxID=1080712 RepID=UPI000A41E160|nr:DUF2012 domain-containing protein [Methanomassiliicoccus luminyensis]
MKFQKVLTLMSVALMLLSATAATIGLSTSTASAARFGDFEYAFIDSTKVKITSYEGLGGEVTIPRFLDGMSVVEIAEGAFQNERTIISVTIPDSVTIIGDGAFRGCTALQHVSIPGTVETIGSFTFYDNHALTSITIPSSVQKIEPLAFWNDYNLATIVFEGPAPAVDTNWIMNPNYGLIAYYLPANAGSFPSELRGGVPTAQLGAKATAPNNLTAISANGEVTLFWDAPTYLGNPSIDQYAIYINVGGEEYRHGIIGAMNNPRYTVSGLDNGTMYSFYVKALRGSINGQNSTVVAAIPLGVSIEYPSEDGAYYTSRTDTISWTIDASVLTELTETSIDGGPWTKVDGTSYQFTVQSDGEHTAKVRATSFVGNTETMFRMFIVDTKAPSVDAKSPTGTDIAIGSVINVTFSEAMNQSSVSIDVDEIDGQIRWDGDTATFTPASVLDYGTKYTVAVTGKDLAGNPMEFMWQFTTLKDEGSIYGVIRDADGKAVADAKVTLSNGMTTTTNASGYFLLEHVPSGNYTLSVAKDGYVYMEKYVDVTAGQSTDAGALSLKAAEGGSSWYIYAVVLAVVAVAAILFVLIRRDRSGGPKEGDPKE